MVVIFDFFKNEIFFFYDNDLFFFVKILCCSIINMIVVKLDFSFIYVS